MSRSLGQPEEYLFVVQEDDDMSYSLALHMLTPIDMGIQIGRAQQVFVRQTLVLDEHAKLSKHGSNTPHETDGPQNVRFVTET